MKNNKGQSSAEFILAFSFIVLFITVFIKVSINFLFEAISFIMQFYDFKVLSRAG